MPIQTRLPLALLVAALVPHPLQGQQPAAQPQLQVGGVELSVGGRVQTQLNTTSVDTEPTSELFIRRARLELEVKVNELVTAVLEPDFAGDEVALKDTYVELAFSPALRLIAGHAKRPFGLLEATSSKRMLPIERGLRIRGLNAADEYRLVNALDYSDRDTGLQLAGAPEGAPLDLAYAAGVFRGPLHGWVGAQDSYQFAARLTASPLESLRLGAGWSNRDFALGWAEVETPELERGSAWEVDLEYGSFAPGFHLLAELTRGDLDPFTGATFRGAQAWLAYRTGGLTPAVTALEPILRTSYAETEGDGTAPLVPGGTLITPGFNVYFGSQNRIMVNYDVWLGADGSPDARSFKAMFQAAF